MSKPSRLNRSVRSALVKASMVTIFCLFIFIVAIGATASTKRLTEDDSASILSGPPVSAETSFESSSLPSDLPPQGIRAEYPYRRSHKQRILDPEQPSTTSSVISSQPHIRNHQHNFNRRHNPNILHRRFANTQPSISTAARQESPSPSFTQKTLTSDPPTTQNLQEQPSTSASTSASTSSPTTNIPQPRRSLTTSPYSWSSFSYYTNKTSDPIMAPTLTILTFLSLSLLGLLLYLGWVVVWRDWGLGVMLQQCVIMGADC